MFTTLVDLILGGAFEQEGSGGGGGGAFQYVRGNYKPSKGTNLTVIARKHPVISPACYFVIILEDLLLHAVCSPHFRLW